MCNFIWTSGFPSSFAQSFLHYVHNCEYRMLCDLHIWLNWKSNYMARSLCLWEIGFTKKFNLPIDLVYQVNWRICSRYLMHEESQLFDYNMINMQSIKRNFVIAKFFQRVLSFVLSIRKLKVPWKYSTHYKLI